MNENQYWMLPEYLKREATKQYVDAMENGMHSNCEEDTQYYKGKIDVLRDIFGADNLKQYDVEQDVET